MDRRYGSQTRGHAYVNKFEILLHAIYSLRQNKTKTTLFQSSSRDDSVHVNLFSFIRSHVVFVVFLSLQSQVCSIPSQLRDRRLILKWWARLKTLQTGGWQDGCAKFQTSTQSCCISRLTSSLLCASNGVSDHPRTVPRQTECVWQSCEAESFSYPEFTWWLQGSSSGGQSFPPAVSNSCCVSCHSSS